MKSYAFYRRIESAGPGYFAANRPREIVVNIPLTDINLAKIAAYHGANVPQDFDTHATSDGVLMVLKLGQPIALFIPSSHDFYGRPMVRFGYECGLANETQRFFC